MDSKEFRKLISDLAIYHGFKKKFGAWFKESNECIIALILRRSGYGNFYYLEIKINLKKAFGKKYVIEKGWIKHGFAHVHGGVLPNDNYLLDLDNPIDDLTRFNKLADIFANYLNPFTDKALSRNGIIDLYCKNEISLLPAVKNELGLE